MLGKTFLLYSCTLFLFITTASAQVCKRIDSLLLFLGKTIIACGGVVSSIQPFFVSGL